MPLLHARLSLDHMRALLIIILKGVRIMKYYDNSFVRLLYLKCQGFHVQFTQKCLYFYILLNG